MINPSLKDLNLSSTELKKTAKLLAKESRIKGYESMSEDDLLRALKASESEKNFDKTRIKEIRKKFNKSKHKFFISKINKIRKDFYEIDNKKDLSVSRIKKIKENLLKLERTLSKTKKYYDTEYDTEYRGIRDVKYLFDFQLMKIIINQ